MVDRSREGALLALAGVIIVALVVALVIVSRQRAREADALQRVGERLATLESRLEQGAPADGAATVERRIAPAFAPPLPYPGLGHGVIEPMDPARELQRQQEQRVELDAQFAAQPPAPRTDAAPQLVVAAFNSDTVLAALAAPRSRNVVCRANGCLIQATFAAGDDVGDWMTRVMLEVGTALPDYRTVNVPQPDGGFELRIYATRPAG
jgi:hypothetical protein